MKSASAHTKELTAVLHKSGQQNRNVLLTMDGGNSILRCHDHNSYRKFISFRVASQQGFGISPAENFIGNRRIIKKGELPVVISKTTPMRN